jgi:hypothetical protein
MVRTTTRQQKTWTPATRRQRCLVYVYTMIGSACFLVGLTGALGSGLQFLFLGLSITLFVLSRSIAVSIRS